MLVAALSSLWIPTFLALSWIHVFTLITLVPVPAGFLAIRRGDRRTHRGCMIGAFAGLVGAGLGALAPGRIVGGAVGSALGLRSAHALRLRQLSRKSMQESAVAMSA